MDFLIPNQEWGLRSRFPPFRYFAIFLTSPKYMLVIEYHVHIRQVWPQLSCGDTCQIWMRFKECSRYFCEIENCTYGEIDERSFSNPHPCSTNPFCPFSASRYCFMALWSLLNPPINVGFRIAWIKPIHIKWWLLIWNPVFPIKYVHDFVLFCCGYIMQNC